MVYELAFELLETDVITISVLQGRCVLGGGGKTLFPDHPTRKIPNVRLQPVCGFPVFLPHVASNYCRTPMLWSWVHPTGVGVRSRG